LHEGEEILERGLCPLSNLHSPLPLAREEGQGDRLLNNLRLKGNIVIMVIIVI